MKLPIVWLSLICGFLENGWNGTPVLKETTCGKASVINFGFHIRPNVNEVFSQENEMKACRSLNPLTSSSVVPKNPDSINPEVLAPGRRGPSARRFTQV